MHTVLKKICKNSGMFYQTFPKENANFVRAIIELAVNRRTFATSFTLQLRNFSTRNLRHSIRRTLIFSVLGRGNSSGRPLQPVIRFESHPRFFERKKRWQWGIDQSNVSMRSFIIVLATIIAASAMFRKPQSFPRNFKKRSSSETNVVFPYALYNG